MGLLTHRMVDANGIRLHVAEQGEGPAVLLCHGWPESWYSWRHQLRDLSQAGFRAIAPDMRGYGQSGRPDAVEAYTLLHLVGDMVGLMDALGLAEAVIAGHDWGAPVAWTAAMMRPDRFRAVIGLSVPYRRRGMVPPTTAMPRRDDAVFYQLYFQPPGVAEADLAADPRRSLLKIFAASSGGSGRDAGEISMVRTGRPYLSGGTVPAPPAWLGADELDFYAAEYARTGFAGGLNWYRNIDRNWELLAPYAGAKVRVPALYVAGEEDLVLAFPGAERVLARLQDDVPLLADKILLPGCGHWTQQERPEAVSAAMIGFIRGL
jgi:pimeloyl-ACP methyl ester carboxylesterase